MASQQQEYGIGPDVLFGRVSGTRAEKTKYHILRSALALMKTTPEELPTINEIIERAEIARSTFYAYFSDKDELYQYIIDEFVSLAEKYLVEHIIGDNLVESIATWLEVCQANREIYVALSCAEGGQFPTEIRQVWKEHLIIMMDKDGMPQNDFRIIHVEYVPRANTDITYAWLTQPHMRQLAPKTLAQFINSQRLNYLPQFVTDNIVLRTPPAIEPLKYVASEVIAATTVRELLRIGGESYLHSHFTDDEILQAESSKISLQYYARFIAAKRVICKCINNHVDERIFPYISISIHDDQRADVLLQGWASSLAQECNVNHIVLSVSYEAEYATAFAIATT